MKTIRFKKLLCLFLSVIIVFSLTTPLSVFAVGGENTRNDLIRQVIAGIITPEEAGSKLGVSSLQDIMPRSSGNLLEDATYYLNNLSFGKYLHYVTPSQDSDFELLGSSDTSIQAEDNNLFADDTEQVDPNVIGLEISPINCISGTLRTLGNTIQWEIQYVPYGYVIRAKYDPTKYLAVSESTTARALTVATITDSTIPDRCIWRITMSELGGCLIQNRYSSQYLYTNGNSVFASTTLGEVDSTEYEARVWRILSTSYYGNTSDHTYREFSTASYFSSCEPTVGQTAPLTLHKHSDKEIWCSLSDFTFEYDSLTIDLDFSSSNIAAKKVGITTVIANHKVTGRMLTFTVDVLPLLILQTSRTYYEDANGSIASDMLCGDMTKDDLRALTWIDWSTFLLSTPQSFRTKWEDMATTFFSTGDLEPVALDMIDHFMEGTGQPYSNNVLTNAVISHQNTISYSSAAQGFINELLSEHNGNILDLLYTPDSGGLLRTEMDTAGYYRPMYNEGSDVLQGLKFCINDVWGVKIEVTEYNLNGNSYEYTIHYTLYDHFGLDIPDVESYGFLAGFQAWFILQHYDEYDEAYKPFLTLIEFDQTVTGTIG